MFSSSANGHAWPVSARGLAILAAIVLLVGASLTLAQAETSPIDQSESLTLNTGDLLLVSSSRESLQFVEIRGNLSATRFSSPPRYPTDTFNFTSSIQGHYTIRLAFSHPSQYEVTMTVKDSNSVKQERASYYVSSGQLLLTIDLDVKAPDPATSIAGSSVWDSFTSWTARFGDAFPLWVKLLYVFLGLQFVAVGYKWIRFENSVREEESLTSRFDRGNLFYLWTEVLSKFLLTAFLVILVAMSGQFILLHVLRFMFLAQVNMLSLWDLFVLGFAAGMTAIAYVAKLCLEKWFDLKPLFQD